MSIRRIVTQGSGFLFKSTQMLAPASLQAKEYCLAQGSVVDEFVTKHRAGFVATMMHRWLTSTSSKSDFDINGLLGIYPLHLWTSEQLEQLFQHAVGRDSSARFASVLDVGSGHGEVTTILRNAVVDINHGGKLITTETSPVMAQKLEQLGFECWNEDISTTYPQRMATGASFDLVSLLNVIDRTPKPVTLLRAAYSMLKHDGLLLVATPLPFRPFYFTNDHKGHSKPSGHQRKHGQPLESLGLTKTGTWDDQAQTLLTQILPTRGFTPLAFSRVPYVSGGDFFKPYTALDDIVVIARKTMIPNNEGV